MSYPLQVKSRGQKDLADDGKRDWDSEIVDTLNDEYPDWKNPKTTHMIPEELHRQGNDGEKAEKTVFNLLKAFGERRQEPMFVVHSYKFRERIAEVKSGFRDISGKLWNIGEHDFVVIHRQAGFIFFQVKAALKTAKVYSKAQKQVEKDHVSMKLFLEQVGLQKANISNSDIDKVFSSFPGFVVMPNCPRPDSSASTYNDGIFQNDCASVDNFSRWWDRNIRRPLCNENDALYKAVKDDLFILLVKRFVGLVLISRCFACRDIIDDSFRALMFNTTEQLKLRLDSCPDKWIVGPAGSGKTCLLMEKVILLAKDIISQELDQKILVVCFNKPLSLMLSRRFEHELKIPLDLQDSEQKEEQGAVVDVKTFDKILKDINGSFNKNDAEKGVEMALTKLKEDVDNAFKQSYDHVFVDEGQDLYSQNWPSLLRMMHKSSPDNFEDGNLNPSYFWVFFDSNQHLHLSKQPVFHSEMRNSQRLYQVLRNTKHVFEQFRKYYKPFLNTSQPVGVYHRELGLEIKWDASIENEKADSDLKGEQSIVERINYLKRNSVQSVDICVLVRDERRRNIVMPKLEAREVQCQNAEELWTEADNNKVVVDSIRRFKGLESKVVILYNPPFRKGHDGRKAEELLYTAMSRCLCYLIVISTDEGCKALKSATGFISGTDVTACSSPNLSQPVTNEPANNGSCTIENASEPLQFLVKRPRHDDANYTHLRDLYNRLKENVGDSGGRL